MARGIKDQLDRWVNDLLARYVPYKYANDKPIGLVQLSIRPVQIYEIVFPEDQLDEVLKTVKPKGYERYKHYNRIIKVLAKMMGLQPIPKWTDDTNFRVTDKWVGVHGIGIKKDPYINGIEQL